MLYLTFKSTLLWISRADTLQMNHLLCQLIPAQTSSQRWGEEDGVTDEDPEDVWVFFCFRWHSRDWIPSGVHLHSAQPPASFSTWGPRLEAPSGTDEPAYVSPSKGSALPLKDSEILNSENFGSFLCFLSPRAGQALRGLIPVTSYPRFMFPDFQPV